MSGVEALDDTSGWWPDTWANAVRPYGGLSKPAPPTVGGVLALVLGSLPVTMSRDV